MSPSSPQLGCGRPISLRVSLSGEHCLVGFDRGTFCVLKLTAPHLTVVALDASRPVVPRLHLLTRCNSLSWSHNVSMPNGRDGGHSDKLIGVTGDGNMILIQESRRTGRLELFKISPPGFTWIKESFEIQAHYVCRQVDRTAAGLLVMRQKRASGVSNAVAITDVTMTFGAANELYRFAGE